MKKVHRKKGLMLHKETLRVLISMNLRMAIGGAVKPSEPGDICTTGSREVACADTDEC
jgi:hypothetical protein